MKSIYLKNDHPLLKNLEYVLEVERTDENGKTIPNIDEYIKKIQAALNDRNFPKNLKGNKEILLNTWFGNHLYQPLPEDAEIQQRKGIKELSVIRPKGLNEGEIRFVEHLRSHLKAEESKKTYEGYSFYLLRNANRGKGLGFYFSASGGFYPDFMLWIRIKKGRKQYLTFIDPHGMRQEDRGFNSDRIQLRKNIKEIPVRGVTLNSFILCPSTFEDAGMVGWLPNGEDLREYANNENVFEIVGDDSEYVGNMIQKIVS